MVHTVYHNDSHESAIMRGEMERIMAREAKAPVASRWQLKREAKGRVFYVLERMPFGKVLLMQEGRAVSADSSVKDLLINFNRLEGKAQLPAGWMA